MTSSLPTADELFRSALASVQDFHINPDHKPAFVLPPAPPRTPKKAPGPIAGLSTDLWAMQEALRAGETTVTDLISAASDRIEGHSQRLNAFEHVAEVKAAMLELDTSAKAGLWRGPLHGIPISVKDIIDVEGMPTTGSSHALPPRMAPRDATAVQRLRQAGAVIMGKTVTHEFALGVTTPQSHNPWDPSRVPGGSSGGSAISLVTGMAHGSLGTDTRASIRVPAALSGTVGFRPTTGLVPVDAWLTLSWSMDVLAPMARSVRDIALMMDVLTASRDTFINALPGSIEGSTIGYSELLWSGIEPGVRECFEGAMKAAEHAGARVVRCDDLTAEDIALSNYAGMVLSRVEAAHFHEGAGTSLELCTPEVEGQLRQAGAVMGVDYVRCLRIREHLYERFQSVFTDIDMLIMPTSEVVAPPIDEASKYLLVLSENCIPWSLVGFPAISLFAGMSAGLPTGVQLVAPAGQDSYLLSAAHALERELPVLPEWTP